MRKISSIAHLLNIFVEEANIVFKPCKTREIPAPLQYPSNLEKLGVGFAESKKNKKPIKLAPVEWENFTKSLLLLSQSFAEFRELGGAYHAREFLLSFHKRREQPRKAERLRKYCPLDEREPSLDYRS